jgi:hypothetical protein
MVKGKTGNLQIFTGLPGKAGACVLPLLTLLTFIFSWLGAYPSRLVERWYARNFFPQISQIAGRFADLVPFAWLDFTIPALLVLLVLLVKKRNWALLMNVAAAGYLIFFWSWGLNYHRPPLASKLPTVNRRTDAESMEEFTRRVASEMNRLFVRKQERHDDGDEIRQEAVHRVRRVVSIIDGSDWQAAHRVKISYIGTPWMRAAGVDGVFNPLAHEPIINDTVLDIERPFVISHELAHVRGYPDEGDANVIAVLATIMSDDPTFQYSGWLNLWLYLRTRDLDKLLDPGPRKDIQRVFDRARAEEVRWINDFQRVLLDLFLKANNVEQGVRSYSRVVIVAAETEPFWEHFR